MSRMPPPPSARGILPGNGPHTLRSGPPPPPLRGPQPQPPPLPSPLVPAPEAPGTVTSAAPFPATAPVPSTLPVSPPFTIAASPSVMPRAPATPPPPPQRLSSPPVARPLTHAPLASATAQLEQRLGATQIELRKLGSERHTLRSRLRREADRLHELESALRAEKELRRQASDEHHAALSGLRARLSELEAERDSLAAEKDKEIARLGQELSQLRAELTQVHERVTLPNPAPTASSARASKAPQGLRRIRGIGPAYQRVLEQLGITRVQQIAAWTSADVLAFADKLKIRADRISKDDWVGQAQALEPDPVD
jgi:predicted flap endonuclease-1-like 5' DNA nuclease